MPLGELAQDRHGVLVRRPRVDDERLPELDCDLGLGTERLGLAIARR